MTIYISNSDSSDEGFKIQPTIPLSNRVDINSGIYLDSDSGEILIFQKQRVTINPPTTGMQRWVLLSIQFSTGDLDITYGTEASIDPIMPNPPPNNFIIGMIITESNNNYISNDMIFQVNSR